MGYLTRRISILLKANLNSFLDRVLGTKPDVDPDLEELLNDLEHEWVREKQQQKQTGTRTHSALPDYYEILEVHYKASEEVIEKAYKTLATKYHPDKQPHDQRVWAEAKMKQINEAYSHLRDPEKRREYDRKRGYSAG